MTTATRQGDEARYRGRKVAGTALVALALGAVAGTFVIETLESDWIGSFGPALSMLPFLAVAAIVVLRRPENPIGSLLTLVTFLLATGGLAERLELRYQGETVGTLSSWYGEWWWVPMLTLLLVVIPLTFPNGQLLSRRWRPVLLLVLCTATIAVTGAWLQSELPIGVGESGELPVVANPIGVAPWPEMEEALPGVLFFGTLFPGALLGVVSLLLRFRRSDGVERQQLKWAAFGLGIMGVGFVTNALRDLLFGFRLSGLVETLFISAIPVAFGFAILRYRLYDIDRIISRAAVYVLLTILLVAVYAGSVVTLQGALRPLTGGSDLAIAASTLVVVALFHPFPLPRLAVDAAGSPPRSRTDPVLRCVRPTRPRAREASAPASHATRGSSRSVFGTVLGHDGEHRAGRPRRGPRPAGGAHGEFRVRPGLRDRCRREPRPRGRRPPRDLAGELRAAASGDARAGR